MNRRQFIGASGAAAFVGLSGCLDSVLDGEFEFTATPASVATETAENRGYEKQKQEEIQIEETVTYDDREQDVSLSNWMTVYAKVGEAESSEEQEIARFVAFSTPQVDVFGQTSLNPVGQMSEEEMIEFAASRADDFADDADVDVRSIGETTVDALGEETSVAKFESTIEIDGHEVDAHLHLTELEHGDDHVIAFAAYPKATDEEENVHALVRNLEHESDGGDDGTEEGEEGDEAEDGDENEDREYEQDGDVVVEGELNGDVSTSGHVRVARGAEVEGDVEAGGRVVLEGDAEVGGSVFAGGRVEVGAGGDIDGTVDAGGAVTVGEDGEVDGDIDTDGAVTIEANGEIDGDITGATVDIADSAAVEGDVTETSE